MMILAVAIVTGFKEEIRNKVVGFHSHILIKNYDSNKSFEDIPISKNQEFLTKWHLDTVAGIEHIEVFATKLGLIKTETANEAILIKGIGSDYDWSFFRSNLVDGKIFNVNDSVITNQIVISKYLANRLKLKVGDEVRVFFVVENKPRARKFIISGIYETGFEDFDKLYSLADIGHIQKLNGWGKDMVGGFEVKITNFDDIDRMGEMVYDLIGTKIDPDGSKLDVQTVKQLNPQIFDWLQLQNINVQIILILMTLVAGFNIVSALLIIILERANMIGILKALGFTNLGIRKIFIYYAIYLIVKGLFWGNIIGLLFCFIQKEFGIITLPQESYYISVVPINIDILHILLLNIGTLIICSLMLIVPSYIVAKISPIKTIRFE